MVGEGQRSRRRRRRMDIDGADSSRVLESSNIEEVGDKGRASLARASASDAVRRVLLLLPLQPRQIAMRFCRAGRLGRYHRRRPGGSPARAIGCSTTEHAHPLERDWPCRYPHCRYDGAPPWT